MNALRQLWRDVKGQKLRTFLTIFGIVWGTAAVSLLLAFGKGFHHQIAKNSAGLGEYIVIAWPSQTSKPWEGLTKGRRIRLDEEDMERLRHEAQGLLSVSGEYSSSLKLHHGAKTIAANVSGVAPVFGDLRNIIPQSGGRFLNVLDEDKRRRVAFMGDKIAKDVFAAQDPIGQTVMLGGSPFTVVGVLQHKAQDSNYDSPDEEKIYIPGSTFRALTGEKFVSNFIFKAGSAKDTEKVKAEVIRVVAAKHRFDPDDKEALAMWDTTEMFVFLDTFMLAFRLFLGIVGSLTLVVGGIGVSNIMNVVVEERTREIGIKMALGAKPRSVLNQFLLETLGITALGGLIGLAISAAVCLVFPSFGVTEYVGNPELSAGVAGGTAALLGTLGLLAGYFPARSASNLDPVVAMKL